MANIPGWLPNHKAINNHRYKNGNRDITGDGTSSVTPTLPDMLFTMKGPHRESYEDIYVTEENVKNSLSNVGNTSLVVKYLSSITLPPA